MKKTIAIMSLIVCITINLCSCSSSPKSLIIGDWYNESGEIDFTFEKSGTFRWRDENANGTYKILSDKTLEMTAKYETETFKWAGNENGNGSEWFVKKGVLYLDGDVFTKKKVN